MCATNRLATLSLSLSSWLSNKTLACCAKNSVAAAAAKWAWRADQVSRRSGQSAASTMSAHTHSAATSLRPPPLVRAYDAASYARQTSFAERVPPSQSVGQSAAAQHLRCADSALTSNLSTATLVYVTNRPPKRIVKIGFGRFLRAGLWPLPDHTSGAAATVAPPLIESKSGAVANRTREGHCRYRRPLVRAAKVAAAAADVCALTAARLHN